MDTSEYRRKEQELIILNIKMFELKAKAEETSYYNCKIYYKKAIEYCEMAIANIQEDLQNIRNVDKRKKRATKNNESDIIEELIT